ncbi:MAG: site-2 protease family protein [Planctomycetota bacterium]
MDVASILNLLLLAFGFGFVIFWHELGHFLAAKWAGVRVEQFAVGFGNAIFSYRKGLGLRRGTSGPEYKQRIAEKPDLDISPTEYRLNWLPLGGYVKMLGQEDLAVPDGGHEPDSYQSKTVGQRMVIISAGVVMNVILAAVLFTVLYSGLVGFSATASRVGSVQPGSPAETAGLQVGDEIVSIDGKPAHDFSKIRLGIALLGRDASADVEVRRLDGSVEALQVQPEVGEATGMLQVGVLPMPSLALPASDDATEAIERARPTFVPGTWAVMPGEQVVSVDNAEVEPGDYPVYATAIDRAGDEGRPVKLVVRESDGMDRIEKVWPLLTPVGDTPDASLQFGGLRPLLKVLSIGTDSPAAPGGRREGEGLDVLRPGDVLLTLRVGETGDLLHRPTREELGEWLNRAGSGGRKVEFDVLRDGEMVTLKDLPLTPLGGGFFSRMVGNVRYGLGANLTDALETTRLATTVREDSAADVESVREIVGDGAEASIVAVGGEAVSNWYEISRFMRNALAEGNTEVDFTIATAAGEQTATLTFDDEATTAVASVDWSGPVSALSPQAGNYVETTRETWNPLQAMWWGVFETRDQIANLYLTLRRVTVDRTVSASNLSGPVGILHFGTIVAARGYDWLLWFLAMLSANLAVVNFLPIPILDGGHMVFLLWEKIRGRAPSRAVQEGALWVGLAALGCFVIFVTYNDLSRLFTL